MPCVPPVQRWVGGNCQRKSVKPGRGAWNRDGDANVRTSDPKTSRHPAHPLYINPSLSHTCSPPMTTDSASDLSYADTLWKSADALRGQVDAAEYKHVVLGLLFLKYISDSFQSRRTWLIPGGPLYFSPSPGHTCSPDGPGSA